MRSSDEAVTPVHRRCIHAIQPTPTVGTLKDAAGQTMDRDIALVVGGGFCS